MPTDTITALLGDLGLTSYEASAYRTLIRRATFTPAELSLKADIPRQRIHDVLKSLKEKGLCHFPTALPRTVAAIEPGLALSALALRRDRSLAEERAQLGEATAELEGQLKPLYQKGQKAQGPLHYIETYRSPVQIASVAEKLAASATEEMNALLTGPPVFTREDGLRLFREPLERGVSVRVVCDHSAPPTLELGKLLRDFRYQGLEVRRPEARFLPLRLMFVKGSGVLIYLLDPLAGPPSYSATLIRHPSMTAAMNLLFETLWHEPRTRRVDPEGHTAA
jgi:sugar-specific transcriptional regulator TrmB